MSASQRPAGSDDDAAAEDLIPPVPDEDGPHDVPDETVIEKTLPAAPLPDSGSDKPR